MARNDIYTVYSKELNSWDCVKMDKDWEVLKTYKVNQQGSIWLCDCYAGNKQTCRHRQMVELFMGMDKVNSRQAYEFDKGRWIKQPDMEA